ncbi:putative membrane protein [Klebsiella oxytoca]|nr:putative membrane protein [Klebsiella oxytoca]
MKASQVHVPHTDPTFMLLICAILTGISWHAFISAILLKPISS